MADEETINAMTQAAATADDAKLANILNQSPPGTVNIPNSYGFTAIQVVNLMSPNTVHILLQHGADPNIPDQNTQKTILHDMAEKGCPDSLELLLIHGANATARDNMGNTPAHLAAREGGPSRIEILERLSLHCTFTEVNNAGKTPLDIAMEKNHGDIVELLQN